VLYKPILFVPQDTPKSNYFRKIRLKLQVFLSKDFAMPFKLSVGALSVAIISTCSLVPALAVLPADKSCPAQSTDQLSLNRRSVDQTFRQKCSSFVGSEPKKRRVSTNQNIQFREGLSEAEAVGMDTSSCISVLDAPAPQGMKWRYRRERTTGIKCWFLVRTIANGVIAVPLVRRIQTVPDHVADAHTPEDALAMLTRSTGAPKVDENSTRQQGSGLSASTDISSDTTFRSRWVFVGRNPTVIAAASLNEPVSSGLDGDRLNDRIGAATVDRIYSPRSEKTSYLLLVAALTSTAVVCALYAMISGSVLLIKRGRASYAHHSRPVYTRRLEFTAPPVASSISDILDRLRMEELESPPPAHSEMHDADERSL
jgi:hypothetical protein